MEVFSLPTLNAALNASATILLLLGRRAIRRRREALHKRCMVSAFGCSVLFLASYVAYHASIGGGVRYAGAGLDRLLYLVLLASHVVLAAIVPWLALRTLWLGLRERRASHRRWARVTYPIWLYVSVSGVAIYLVLYHLTDSAVRSALHG